MNKNKEKLTQGLIQIYTGNAKGKSTAAFGLAVRAAGHGFKVIVIQFMKTGSYYGEIPGLKRLAPEVEIHSYGKEGFISQRGVTEEDISLAIRPWLTRKEPLPIRRLIF